MSANVTSIYGNPNGYHAEQFRGVFWSIYHWVTDEKDIRYRKVVDILPITSEERMRRIVDALNEELASS